MKTTIKGLAALAGLAVAMGASAANKPCSGSKGGVARCDGASFVCNDGSYSASKKVCSAGDSSAGERVASSSGSSSHASSRRGGRRH